MITSPRTIPSHPVRVAFWIGLSVYLSVQLGAVLHISSHRSVPVETDDGYTYLQKAVQLGTCFRQTCAAIEDLRDQLTPLTNDAQIDYLRWRAYNNGVVIYHPLHSVVLFGFRSVLPDWEAAYDALQIAGALLIGLATACLLRSIWGAGPTGVALLLLSAETHFLYVTPSTLALGLAAFLWAGTIARPSAAGWLVPIGVCLMIAMHPIGRVFAVPSLALLVAVRGWRSSTTPIVVTSAAVLLSFAVTFVLRRPDLLVVPEPFPHWWGSSEGLEANVREVSRVLTDWLSTNGSALLAIPLLALGLAMTPRDRRRPLASLLISLAALLAPAVAHVLNDPADVFTRIWPGFAVLLAGAIGQAIWWWIEAVGRLIGGLSMPTSPMPRQWSVIVLLVVSVGVVQLGRHQSRAQIPDLLADVQSLTERQNTRLDPAQPELLLRRGCGQVVYTAEVPMHFYFTHGALHCGAVYIPTLGGEDDELRLIGKNRSITHLVDWIPAATSQLMDGGQSLTLSPGDHLDMLATVAIPLPAVQILVETDSDASTLRFVPPNTARWQAVAANQIEPGVVRLGLPGDGSMRLRGLRLTPGASLHWPWDQGISLRHVPAQPSAAARTIVFETQRYADLLDRPVRILDDSGDTVLVEAVRSDAHDRSPLRRPASHP